MTYLQLQRGIAHTHTPHTVQNGIQRVESPTDTDKVTRGQTATVVFLARVRGQFAVSVALTHVTPVSWDSGFMVLDPD